MSAGNFNPQKNTTPVFGLTKKQLRPILDNIVSDDTVASFEVSIEHQVQGYYGYQAEKVLPTFIYTTATGRTGKVVLLVKWFYRTGVRLTSSSRAALSDQPPPSAPGVRPGAPRHTEARPAVG